MSLSKIFVNNTLVASVDTEPTTGSNELVESGGVKELFDGQYGLSIGSDFSIDDENNNSIVMFKSGHIVTKNFNSETTAEKLDTIEEGAEVNNIKIDESVKPDDDLEFTDEDNNILVKFKNGHIVTKNFDSENIIEEIDTIKASKNYSFNSVFNTQPFLGNFEVQFPDKDINIAIIYGQSLSTGQLGAPVLSKINFRGNLMFGEDEWAANNGTYEDGEFRPLIAKPLGKPQDYAPSSNSDQTNGETPNLNFVNALKNLYDNISYGYSDGKVFLDISVGVGGISIEMLSKNCPNGNGQKYTQLLAALNAINQKAQAQNKSIAVTSVIWMLGEWNYTLSPHSQGWLPNTEATKDKDDYKAYLIGGTTSDGVTHNGLVHDLEEDIMSIFNLKRPLFLTYNVGPNYVTNDKCSIDMAIIEASQEVDNLILAAPTYAVTDRGGHLDPNGYRWMGEYFSKAYYNYVFNHKRWTCLYPSSFERKSDTAIVISFNVPAGPLKIDTHLVRQKSNLGFKLFNADNMTELTISSVSLIDSCSLQIVSQSTLPEKIGVSYAGKNVTYGNLRDSDMWESFERYINLDTVVENPEGVSYKPAFEPTDNDGNIIYGKKYPCYNFCTRFYYEFTNKLNIQL